MNVFETKITTLPKMAGHALFKAQITVGGRAVFTRYYTNNPQAQVAFFEGSESRYTTRKAIYDHTEAEVFLLQDFAKFLEGRWT